MTRELTVQDFGYAPGNYTFFCHDCGQDAVGDKRCLRCETCANQAMRESRSGAKTLIQLSPRREAQLETALGQWLHDFGSTNELSQRTRILLNMPLQSKPCDHPRSEFVARKGDAFEMRKCLECTKIFRVRLREKASALQCLCNDPNAGECPVHD